MSWKSDFQDFWTGTVLEYQATSGSTLTNVFFGVHVCIQTCHFAFIKSEIMDSVAYPRSSKDRHKKNSRKTCYF